METSAGVRLVDLDYRTSCRESVEEKGYAKEFEASEAVNAEVLETNPVAASESDAAVEMEVRDWN
jgi:hypothetical protein